MDPRKRVLLVLASRMEAQLDVPEPAEDAPEAALSSTETELCCPNCGALDVAVEQADAAEVEAPPGVVEYDLDPEVITVAICRACGTDFSAGGGPGRPFAAVAIVQAEVESRSVRLRRAALSDALENADVRNALLR